MRKVISKAFFLATLFTSALYFFSCFTPYISPEHFSLLAFFELAFPYLAFSIVAFIFTWLFIRRKVSLLLLLLLFVGYKNLLSTIAFHFSKADASKISNAKSLQILTWNVRGFDNPSINADSLTSKRHQMFEYIKKSGADILCLQEFNELFAKGVFSNTNELVNLGYSYYYLTNDIRRVLPWGIAISESAIFSKIPLQDTGRVMLGDSTFPEYLGYADVMMNKKPLRIFTTHFKSINLFAQTVDTISPVIFHGDKEYVYKASKMEKLQVFSQEHSRQATIAKNVFSASGFPVLFAGDLNSVPTSYAYHTISVGLQDAFLHKGCGFGGTLDSLPFSLRIDYVFADKKINIIEWRKDILHASDHYPQQVKIAWKD